MAMASEKLFRIEREKATKSEKHSEIKLVLMKMKNTCKKKTMILFYIAS